jgi:putative PIN family toxin of toxin-antitoxin system
VIVVLDTNVVVAALVAKGLCLEVVQRAIAMRCLATSAALVQELESTLHDKFTVTPSTSRFVRLFQQHAMVFEPILPARQVCRDPDDDTVLGTAAAARANFIVTGDRDLLVLKDYEGIRIITPREFLEILSGGAGTP